MFFSLNWFLRRPAPSYSTKSHPRSTSATKAVNSLGPKVTTSPDQRSINQVDHHEGPHQGCPPIRTPNLYMARTLFPLLTNVLRFSTGLSQDWSSHSRSLPAHPHSHAHARRGPSESRRSSGAVTLRPGLRRRVATGPPRTPSQPIAATLAGVEDAVSGALAAAGDDNRLALPHGPAGVARFAERGQRLEFSTLVVHGPHGSHGPTRSTPARGMQSADGVLERAWSACLDLSSDLLSRAAHQRDARSLDGLAPSRVTDQFRKL